jgi:hypothetical protein
LGLKCFSSYSENQLERLKNEIESIIKSMDESSMPLSRKDQSLRMSVIKKLKGAENYMDMIECI